MAVVQAVVTMIMLGLISLLLSEIKLELKKRNTIAERQNEILREEVKNIETSLKNK